MPNVNPAGLNTPGSLPTGGGTNASGFQGFPNFQVPFPYLNLPAQLQASMQTPRNQTYGRFGNMPAPAQGMPGSLPQLPPQAQGNLPQQGSGFLPVQPPSPSGLPQLPTQQQGHDLGPVIAQRIEAMRQRAQAYQNSGPTLDQFKQTFNSLPEAERFVYWNSLPQNGSGAIDQYLSGVPGFRSWVNEMFNNYNGGGLAGAKWDFANNRIMG